MTEHEQRVARYQEALAARGLAGALLLNTVDVYYLTGTAQNGALLVPAAGAPTLLVRKSFRRARAETALADVRPFPPSRELAAALGAKGKIGAAFEAVPQGTLDFWRKVLPQAELVDAGPILRAQRQVKSPAELAILREGARRSCAVYAELPTFLRVGMRELDVAAEVEARLRKAGNEGSAKVRAFNAHFFLGVVVAGDGALVPGAFDGPVVGGGLGPANPGGASERPVRRDEPVLVDYCVVHQGYAADMARTAVVGALVPELARAFDVARTIHDAIGRDLRPGVVPATLWDRAKAMAADAGLGDRFMGPPGDQARFVGHGIGLELDELPVLAPGFEEPLREGMVVAVEPKFVFPELGAVGVENTFAVTAQGGDKLTGFLPDDLIRVAA